VPANSRWNGPAASKTQFDAPGSWAGRFTTTLGSMELAL